MLKPIIAMACVCTAASTAAQAQPAREPERAGPTLMVVKVGRNDVLRMRSGPSAQATVVGELPLGTRGITIIGVCRSKWCPVQHQSVTGWVKRDHLEEEPSTRPLRASAPGEAHAPVPPRPRLAVGRRLAVFSDPGEAPKNPAEAAFVYFRAHGWSEHQAAGIVGNLQAECGPALTCSIASGGIAQWRAERVTRFRKVFGYSLLQATFYDQLDYIQWELTHPKSPWKDSGRILKDAKDAASAAALFDIHYERSSGGARAIRMANARAILRKYGGRPAS